MNSRPRTVDRPPAHRWIARVTWFTLALVAGCGPGSSQDKPAASAAPVTITCLATHQFGGDEKSDFVTALALVDNVLLVGSKKRLSSLVYDPKTKKFEQNPLVPASGGNGTDFEVNRIRRDGKQILVATNDGFATYDGKSWSSESMGPVNDIVSCEGQMWIGRNRGLERKSGQDWREEKVPAIKLNPTLSSRIHGLVVTPEGRLWVGSEFGIYSFLSKEKRWGSQLYGDYQNILNDVITNEKGNSELAGNQISSLDLDAQSGKLLVCTQKGLSVFDGKESWKTFQGDYEILTTESGAMTRVKKSGNCALPSAEVKSALIVGGVLWIATPSGLARVEGDKTELFDTDHGLPASAVTSLAHDGLNSVLYVGTEKGVAVLGPVAAAPASVGPAKTQ